MNKDLAALIRQTATALIEAGAREVYLFGSAMEDKLDHESDIDLAVSGLPEDIFFRAMGLARRILKRPVDLVDLDESTPFTSYLKKRGKLKRVG